MTPTSRPLPPSETFTLRLMTFDAAALPVVLGTAEHGPAVTAGPSPFLASDPRTGKAFLARLYALAVTHGETEHHPTPATPIGGIAPPLEHQS